MFFLSKFHYSKPLYLRKTNIQVYLLGKTLSTYILLVIHVICKELSTYLSLMNYIIYYSKFHYLDLKKNQYYPRSLLSRTHYPRQLFLVNAIHTYIFCVKSIILNLCTWEKSLSKFIIRKPIIHCYEKTLSTYFFLAKIISPNFSVYRKYLSATFPIRKVIIHVIWNDEPYYSGCLLKTIEMCG